MTSCKKAVEKTLVEETMEVEIVQENTAQEQTIQVETQELVHVTGGDGTAVYVGTGHEAASDPVTGRTTGAVETAKAELVHGASRRGGGAGVRGDYAGSGGHGVWILMELVLKIRLLADF